MNFKVNDKVRIKRTGEIVTIKKIYSKFEFFKDNCISISAKDKDEIWYLTFDGDYSKIDEEGYLIENDLENV